MSHNGSQSTSDYPASLWDSFFSGLDFFELEGQGGADLRTVTAFDNPYGIPDVPFEFYTLNKDGGWLSGPGFISDFVTPGKDLNPGDSGSVRDLNLDPPRGREEALQMVAEEVARRERNLGFPLRVSEIQALRDTYLQLAGLPPESFTVDERGAAILNTFDPLPSNGSMFAPVIDLFEGAIEATQTVARSVPLVAAAAIIIGIVLLRR